MAKNAKTLKYVIVIYCASEYNKKKYLKQLGISGKRSKRHLRQKNSQEQQIYFF